MTPLIAEGIYKIFNVRYSSSGVDLVHGNPLGKVSGYADGGDDASVTSVNRKWKVWNFGSDGNQILLESIAAPGSYVSGHAQCEEPSLFGFAHPTVWTVQSVARDKFRLATGDGLYVWVLSGSDNYAMIELKPASENEGTDAQWSFMPMSG